MSNIEGDITVDSIRVKDLDGDLFAHFTVRQKASNGEEIAVNTGEWVDYDDGLLEAVDSNLFCSGHFSRDVIGEIHAIVNDHFRKNPIDEDLLESYQRAAEDRREADREEANALSL